MAFVGGRAGIAAALRPLLASHYPGLQCVAMTEPSRALMAKLPQSLHTVTDILT